MTTQDALLSALALILSQALIAIVLPKLNPQSLGAKVLSFIASQLPLAFAHASPSVPQAIASQKAQPEKKAPPPSLPLAGAMALALGLLGCATAQTIIKDATGAVCEIVIQDVAPGVPGAPICTTVEEVEQAIADWLATHAASDVASGQLSQHEKYLAVQAYQAKKAARR